MILVGPRRDTFKRGRGGVVDLINSVRSSIYLSVADANQTLLVLRVSIMLPPRVQT